LTVAGLVASAGAQANDAARPTPPARLTGIEEVAPIPQAVRDGMAAALSAEGLVQQVLARNPSLAQMRAAWQAASARYPQVTSLDDPMFGSTFAPASIGSANVDFGYRLEISQKYPFPGKRALRGQGALAEASAAGHDIDDMRLQLIEAARSAFYDYYLVGRALAVNDESVQLLKEFRQNAESRYRTALVPQQDVLQADVELARQQERRLTLERMRQVATARINTLMHSAPDEPLLPPPERLEALEPSPEAKLLRMAALDRRPDVRALTDRIRGDQAALALAQKEFRPDFEVTAAYDTIMGNGPTRDLAPQVGVRLNLPVRRAKRCGAVAEAEARLAERQAELDRQIDQVNFQVQEAYEQARESERVVALYKERIVPAAEANVKAAQSAYVTGKTPFLSLVEAQRSLIDLRARRYEAIAEWHRRRATLERVIGGELPASPRPDGRTND
jgi:outer membrane protein TolC